MRTPGSERAIFNLAPIFGPDSDEAQQIAVIAEHFDVELLEVDGARLREPVVIQQGGVVNG